MGWRTVVITQHAKVSLSARNLVIQTDTDKYHVPVTDIQVLLMTTLQAVITTAAIAALAEEQAKVIFSGRDGQPICETMGGYPPARSATLIRAQLEWGDERQSILWTKLVASKIQNQMQVLDFLAVETDPLAVELGKLEVNDATNREAVVARKYFPAVFGEEFTRGDFVPINAALNYGYSILLSAVDRAIVANGYLTYLGIHHDGTENPYNLGSDLMEPFRPVIDQWLSQQVMGEFTPDIKYGLVDLLNVELGLNGENTILRNAIDKHVANCVQFLSGQKDSVQVEVTLPREVSAYEIASDV